MSTTVEDLKKEEPPKIPTLVFLFDIKQWNQQLNPLTKLEFIDFIPNICSQFFYDGSVPAYVMTLTKDKWDSISPEIKIKYKAITRRLREEVEGPMTQAQRDAYDAADPFDMFRKKQEETSNMVDNESNKMDSIPETQEEQEQDNQDTNDGLDIKSIEESLSRE